MRHYYRGPYISIKLALLLSLLGVIASDPSLGPCRLPLLCCAAYTEGRAEFPTSDKLESNETCKKAAEGPCVFVRVYVYTNVYMYNYIYICTTINIHICLCITVYIYIHIPE